MINGILLQALAENHVDEPRSIVFKGVCAGQWSDADAEAWDGLSQAEQRRLINRERRGSGYIREPYQTRKNRPLDEGRYRHGGFIATQSSQATLDTVALPAGAVRFLNVLTMRRGKGRPITVYTAAFARDLRCCARTIRNWITALVSAGYVTRVVLPHSKLTHLCLTDRCYAMAFRDRMRKRERPQVSDSIEPERQKIADTEDTGSKESKLERTAPSGPVGSRTGARDQEARTPGGAGRPGLPLVGGGMRVSVPPDPHPEEGHPVDGLSAGPKGQSIGQSPLGKLSAGVLNKLARIGSNARPGAVSAGEKSLGRLSAGALTRFLSPSSPQEACRTHPGTDWAFCGSRPPSNGDP